jgi:hypothetical protein
LSVRLMLNGGDVYSLTHLAFVMWFPPFAYLVGRPNSTTYLSGFFHCCYNRLHVWCHAVPILFLSYGWDCLIKISFNYKYIKIFFLFFFIFNNRTSKWFKKIKIKIIWSKKIKNFKNYFLNAKTNTLKNCHGMTRLTL